MCQISTGAGFATRKLYTDNDEVIFEATRAMILTGIGGIANRPDFLSRSLVIELPQIPEDERRSEAAFWPAFEEAIPRILGALLDTLAGVLAVLPDMKLDVAPRLADFARTGTAVERVLAWPTGSFLEALEDTQSAAMSDALDGEPIAAPVIALAKKWREWSGTPTRLHNALTASADEEVTRRRTWPANAAQLGTRLRRIAPALRDAGVEFDDGSTGRGREKTREYRLTWTGADDDHAAGDDDAEPAADGGDGGDDGDDGDAPPTDA